MITLNASGSSVTFTFDGNSTYLNDGTITVPKNSLALIADESDMVTFRKSASNDIFVSANIAEFGMTKDELIAWYKANMVSSGGGGGGGVTPSEVQTMIDESISGKVDTNTYTAYTAATNSVLSGKQDTLSAGTGISIVDNVISATGGGGGECTVEETVVYERKTNGYSDLDGDNKVIYTILNYTGDKSTATNRSLGFNIGDASNDYASGWITFDYVNHSANTDSLSDYVTVEYINDIQDFKVSVASAYQSSYWFRQIYGTDDYLGILIPYYTINSGSPCTVITTDIVGLIEKVKDNTDKSIHEAHISADKTKIRYSYTLYNGNSSDNYITLEDLDGSDNILKTNIQVGLGISGWTELDLTNIQCQLPDDKVKGYTTFRISGDTTDLSLWALNIAVGWNNNYNWDYIEWDSNENTFVRNPGWSPDVFSSATVTWDSNTAYLTVSYPTSVIVDGEAKQTEFYFINNGQCQYGQAITKFEYYNELTQPLKPYVQQLRSDVNTISGQVATKQDTLSAGTGIEISGNVISATGGGGEVSSVITSGDTNAVAGGAVFDAVVYSANTYNTELTFDANGYAENWVVGQSAITIDVSEYTSDTRAVYHFENSNGLGLGEAQIFKVIGSWGGQWGNNADNCTITTDGDTATTATITNIPSGTVKIRRRGEINPPKAIISGGTPEIWIKDALDDHRDNTTVHITAAERTAWNAKSDFSGSYNDLTDKPTIPTVPTSNTAFTNDAGYITSGEAQTQIDNSISGKVDTTTYSTYTAATDSRLAEDEEVTARALNNLAEADEVAARALVDLDDRFGGLKLVKLSQQEYDNLQTKDSNTLYVIVN